MQLTLTEFHYLVKVRQHEDNIQDQIQKIENLHYDKIGALNDIPELKERIRQINEFNLDMISRADGNLMQKIKPPIILRLCSEKNRWISYGRRFSS